MKLLQFKTSYLRVLPDSGLQVNLPSDKFKNLFNFSPLYKVIPRIHPAGGYFFKRRNEYTNSIGFRRITEDKKCRLYFINNLNDVFSGKVEAGETQKYGDFILNKWVKRGAEIPDIIYEELT